MIHTLHIDRVEGVLRFAGVEEVKIEYYSHKRDKISVNGVNEVSSNYERRRF